MEEAFSISASKLRARRQLLGMSYAALAQRSRVSEPTAKRILSGHIGEASFAHVIAIAATLGVSIETEETDVDELCRREARRKAELVARLVQGTSALENQAVNAEEYNRLVERSYHELMAGSRRRLWSK